MLRPLPATNEHSYNPPGTTYWDAYKYSSASKPAKEGRVVIRLLLRYLIDHDGQRNGVIMNTGENSASNVTGARGDHSGKGIIC